MKYILLILLCASCSVKSPAPPTEPPSVVLAGLDAYQAKGLKPAYEVWSKGTLENDEASRNAVMSGLAHVELTYGKMSGYNIVKTVPISSAVQRVYVVLLYERGPVFGFMDCYKAGEKWLVTDLLFHTKANAVFPPQLLGG
jgi:hypothetical protein